MKAYVVLRTQTDPESNAETGAAVAQAFTTIAEARKFAEAQPVPLGNPRWHSKGACYEHGGHPVRGYYESGCSTMYIIEVQVSESASEFVPKESPNVAALKEIAAREPKISSKDVVSIIEIVREENLVMLPEATSFSYCYAVYHPETKERLCGFEKSRLPKGADFEYMRKEVFGTKRNLFVAKACGFPEIREEGHYEY
jgi:hypothetical protein